MCDHCSCREYAPIADLTADHEVILELAWRLVESGGADGGARDALVARLDVHVEKEETGLYPALMEAGGLSSERNDALEAEHRELRTLLVSGGAFDRRAYFARAAHIEEEELELFPAARFGFDDEEWDRLAVATA